MASTTTVLGLTKPAYTDDSDISDINGNMDLIDAEVAKVRGNVAADYDSAQTYAIGDLCLHDGNLEKCNTPISSPEAWNASHWTQVTIDGELTALNGKIITKETEAITAGTNVTLDYQDACKLLGFCEITIVASKTQWAEGDTVGTLPAGYRPRYTRVVEAVNYNMPSDNVQISINTSGVVSIWNKGVQAAGKIYIHIVFML